MSKDKIKKAWLEYQKTEKNGIELGKVLCEYRNDFKSKGGYGSDGEGLVQLLDEFSIPRATAYWWINKYEVSIGIKEPKPKQIPAPPKEKEYEPLKEKEEWSRDKERRKNREEPVKDAKELKDLAIKMLKEGHKVLLDSGEDKGRLWSAKEWALAKLGINV